MPSYTMRDDEGRLFKLGRCGDADLANQLRPYPDGFHLFVEDSGVWVNDSGGQVYHEPGSTDYNTLEAGISSDPRPDPVTITFTPSSPISAVYPTAVVITVNVDCFLRIFNEGYLVASGDADALGGNAMTIPSTGTWIVQGSAPGYRDANETVEAT